MLTPAFIYALMNWNRPSMIGWAIPMATDPAFAITILSVLRSRIPAGLRAFLVSLAVVDDIGAIVVIALIYHEGFLLPPILISLAIVILLLLINRAGVSSLLPYLILGAFLWVAFKGSGIHTSVAGVVLALTIPVRSLNQEQNVPLIRLEHALIPWVNYLILPVFALSNAGITFQDVSFATIVLTPVVPGIFLGLLIGKPLGIVLASFLAVFLRAAHLPQGVYWKHIAGAGFLGGIGFTTSIFLANLAFAGNLLFDQSKIGILTASIFAATLGWLILMKVSTAERQSQLTHRT
jgi:NhaA family Na+:H+ antiporter